MNYERAMLHIERANEILSFGVKRKERDENQSMNAPRNAPKRDPPKQRNFEPYDALPYRQQRANVASEEEEEEEDFDARNPQYSPSKRSIWLWPRGSPEDEEFRMDWRKGGFQGWEGTYYMMKNAVKNNANIKTEKFEKHEKYANVRDNVILDLADLDDLHRKQFIKATVGENIRTSTGKLDFVCGERIVGQYTATKITNSRKGIRKKSPFFDELNKCTLFYKNRHGFCLMKRIDSSETAKDNKLPWDDTIGEYLYLALVCAPQSGREFMGTNVQAGIVDNIAETLNTANILIAAVYYKVDFWKSRGYVLVHNKTMNPLQI